MNTRYLLFIGRVLIGLPFAMSGLSKLAAYSKTTAMIAAAGLPFPPLAFAVIPQQFRRPEPDDPLSEERHDGRWPAPNRRLRGWSDQHRAVAPEDRNVFRS
jgi:hypothetical protein